MALTEDALIDRVRAVVVAQDLTEAIGFDFLKQPSLAVHNAFIVSFQGESPNALIGMQEEARGVVTVQGVTVRNNDDQMARRTAWQKMRAVFNALVEDGAVTSGEYAVESGSRTFRVEAPKGANYFVWSLTAAVNFEASL